MPMKPAAVQERDGIIRDLSAIIRDLERAASEASQLKGIGAEKLAASLYDLARYYRNVQQRVRNLS